MVVLLYELVWLGMEWDCWVRVIMVCCSCLTVISWGICLIRVLVWCVVVPRLLDVFVVKRGMWF